MSEKLSGQTSYLHLRRPQPRLRQRLKIVFLFLLAFVVIMGVPSILYFRDLSGSIALSDAQDLITQEVNDIVLETMSDPVLEKQNFVNFERDSDGHIAAIITDMARVNTLSSELLNAIVHASNMGELDIRIPLGNLLGLGILLGRGPDVPVRITMLTSSHTAFHNELVSAGINQTKHQVMLELFVDVNVLLPWEVLSTQVVSEVLVAETIIVGSVPNTYLNWENSNG